MARPEGRSLVDRGEICSSSASGPDRGRPKRDRRDRR
ncbi:hypothetical protein R2601_04133 [Salipiger bermudensis HTCC2601]|uniref:Uncharacterized protein n=1 Tax=Salipiger bermudensis (strain DSM 26914 / JCM 13377 / KCTC 12554 / HTCC2601) TaxID=314265 RepID=Q0FW19_SALBH|nr:hypothetical protein R2601_04133 [Salipiger bermudensis HTCC2601]